MTQSHETKTFETYTSEQIDSALLSAQDTVDRLQSDPNFLQSCVDSNIDINDQSAPEYWHNVRLFTGQYVDGEKAKGGDALKMDAIDLVANTPAYLLENQKLKSRDFSSLQDRRYSKEMASYYNGMVRDFALKYPETSVNSVSSALNSSVARTFRSTVEQQSGSQQIRDTIRGAQHELAFAQLLEGTGLPYRPATVAEDLRGYDYMVGEGDKAVGIDVKASLSEIENRGSQGAFALTHDGKIVMYSMTLDQEFNDRFFIDQALADQKAPQLLMQLATAQRQLTAS